MVQGYNESLNGQALSAAIVGSGTFFLLAVLLAICIVKICNKKKREKIEKCKTNLFAAVQNITDDPIAAYMMVTCPVNGTHSYGDSPVPSKPYVFHH